MTSPTDLIRREEALKIIEAAKRDFQDPEDGLRAAGDHIRALPADPVAEAALRLAEAWCSDPHSAGFGQRFRDAVETYRAAVAARDGKEKR